MAKGINKVILVGNLGQEPEMRYMPSGDAVCNMSLATSETWKDKETGEKREATEWHRLVAFRGLGEVCGEYLHKGSQIYCEGKLQTRKWQDNAGNDRYTTEVIIGNMVMLGGRQEGGGGSESRGGEQPARQEYSQAPEDFDDDIPF